MSDIFTLDENNNAAVRTVSVNAGATESNQPDIFTTDENGNAAVRVVGSGGGGQVTSVNNQTGDVVLTPSDIGATSMSVPTAPTLAVADWSSNTQSVTVNGVTASNTVIVSPAPASAVEYAACGILCTTQGTDSLTFSCQTTPTNNLTVNVVILN